MKELHLVYGDIEKIYVYFEGEKGGVQRNQHRWREEDLIQELRKTLNFKRKSVLYLNFVHREIIEKIHKLVKNTKISLSDKLQTN